MCKRVWSKLEARYRLIGHIPATGLLDTKPATWAQALFELVVKAKVEKEPVKIHCQAKHYLRALPDFYIIKTYATKTSKGKSRISEKERWAYRLPIINKDPRTGNLSAVIFAPSKGLITPRARN